MLLSMDAPPGLASKPPCRREDAEAVLRRLREAGHVAYFAGGCVRDLLLGHKPKDWDVATDAPPRRVRQLFPNTQAVGAAFGVILVRQGGSVVEVATFRAEGEYLDGRRPSQVHFTNAEHDASRRDFTINGLFLDPLENDRVIDYVGGQRDLADHVLRAIGDPAKRFEEDHLRLLRAVRFASRFDFQIEPATSAAIAAASPLLKQISPERIADELRLSLMPPTRDRAWRLLWQYRLLHVVYRFLPLEAGVTLDPSRSIFLNLLPGRGIGFGLALAGGVLCARWQAGGDIRLLLTGRAVRHDVHAMRQALRISNDEMDEMQQTLDGIEPLLRDEPSRVAAMKRFLARATSPQSRALMDALRAVGIEPERIDWLKGELSRLEKEDVAPPPLITGDDLTAAGLTPGPAFKRILDTVYDAQLEGRVTMRDEAMAMAMAMAMKING